MSTNVSATTRGISFPLFFAGLTAGWFVPSAVVGLSPESSLRTLILENWAFYEFLGTIVAISFLYFFWLAGVRWPTSSTTGRFGFAIGLAVLNYVAVLYSAFMLRVLIHGL